MDYQDLEFTLRPGFSLHHTSIRYLEFLMTPIINRLNQIIIYADFEYWIEQNLPRGYISLINDNIDTLYEDPTPIHMKNEILNTIIAGILDLTHSDIIATHYDTIILPWDIQYTIITDVELNSIFHFPRINQLPVSLIINNVRYNHVLEEETTIGILLFIYLSQTNVQIEMFGVLFTTDYLTQRLTRYKHRRKNRYYQVITNNGRFEFLSPFFIQGFISCAGWEGLNHRQYWTHLYEETYTETSQDQRELTF
jgi:hypothetical protein